MKILYMDLGMGAAGDMLTAALLELCDDADRLLEKLNSLDIPGVRFRRELMKKSGICGTHMRVFVNGNEEECAEKEDGHIHEEHNVNKLKAGETNLHHEHVHHHTSMSDIKSIVSMLNVSEKIKKQILDIYNIIAVAESIVHGEKVEQIHFHEVGNMDAIADIAAACMLIDELGIEKIVASPVHTGSGYVTCAHGKLPVPAPATAVILEGIPSYSDGIKGELCTPTGAALIKYFVDEFADMPLMSVYKIGYGLGTKEFERLNCVRCFLGTPYKNLTDNIVELACNIDDMTAEEIGFATEKILEAGALDVYTVPAYMKKNRPGTLICCLCNEMEKERFVKIIFKYTTTIGIRQYECKRYILARDMEKIRTDYGDVRVKKSYGYGVERQKIEYDDLSNIANKRQKSVFEIKHDINH